MTTAHRPAPSRNAPARPEARSLTRAECRAWIAGHDEARLRFDTGRGPRSVVVGYAVRADEVLLLLPEYHPATGYLLDAPVVLEVDGAAPEGAWETVRASGVAYLGRTDESVPVRPYGASWPPGVAARTVHVPLDRVEGVLRAA